MSTLDLSGAVWRISSYSGNDVGSCVEVAGVPSGHLIATRDSTDRSGPVLTFGRHEWATLLNAVKKGDLDLVQR
ncbi:DUF397 domain-containing protein [Actinomadura barringtoniae]|uniref:DUF397 domain-containing protein n=1 Tax=Actinomadura barringtoniae TaxID=1427535 RepID=A0A939T722_9ACTN|nr:DUF397 domain-containing protein [Actinomadura barringtoniae]MBO2455601.1 DUF397 domain-containing protein [Actinomadura barringtoniae]